MNTAAAFKLVLLTSVVGLAYSEELVYNEEILRGYHHYNPAPEKTNSNVKALRSDVPIITNALAKFLFIGAGPKEGSLEFWASPDEPNNSRCGGQIGIEWLARTYCLHKMVLDTEEHYPADDFFTAPSSIAQPQILENQSDTGGNTNFLSSLMKTSSSILKTSSSILKSSIMLPIDMTMYMKDLILPEPVSTSWVIGSTIRTAALKLYLRNTKESDQIEMTVPLFQESSQASEQAKYAKSALRCKPFPLQQVRNLLRGKKLIEFEVGWISDLFHKPMTIDTNAIAATYVTYPVVMPQIIMGELLRLVNEMNPKKRPIETIPVDLDSLTDAQPIDIDDLW